MTVITRREMVAASSAALLIAGTARAQGHAKIAPFSWDSLIARAEALARTPYVDEPPHPRAAAVDYDALHRARFRDDRTIWNGFGDNCGVRLFPLSSTVDRPIFLHLIEKGQARPLDYDPDYFDMPAGSPVRALGRNAGFGGFRMITAARDADWLVFMGASYFRAAGAQKQYGLSARAVAVDTSSGREEFPRFTHFWLDRTGPDRLDIYALLDGPSIAGAYRFHNRICPEGVTQDVDAVLFPRRVIAELGLMPMTSMFWYDQASGSGGKDWRPEVHDSDGLLIRSANGAAHFRPLVNPPAPRTSFFAERDPQGFGLLQRDREFSHYQDDGVFYDRRPSLFATPREPLGGGHVRLYEFPTGSEYTDNVAAYWTAVEPAAAGSRIPLSYQLDWSADAPPAPRPLAVLRNIWRGQSAARNDGSAVRLIADFDGIDRPRGQAELWLELTDGVVIKTAAYPLVGQKAVWRAVMDIVPSPGCEVRAQIRSGGVALSEMLHYPLFR